MNILIFRTDRIGDLLFACPTITTIKKYFTNSNITLISSSKNNFYAQSLNIFDNIYEFPKKGIFKKIKFIFTLAKKEYDYIFVLDGKERSVITTKFIKGKCKVAIISKEKSYYKLLGIKFFFDEEKDNLNKIYQKMINYCNIKIKINNYFFLKNKKNNNYSLKIPIKNYIQIHLDEKWFSNLYITKYTNINPRYDEFVDFLNNISKINNILITTGNINFTLIDELKRKYFDKKSDEIFYKKNYNNLIYFVVKNTFDDIESLLRNAKVLVSCHGAITHAANSLQVSQIDIIEENKKNFYKKFTLYINIYSQLYRTSFGLLKNTLLKNLSTYE